MAPGVSEKTESSLHELPSSCSTCGRQSGGSGTRVVTNRRAGSSSTYFGGLWRGVKVPLGQQGGRDVRGWHVVDGVQKSVDS